MIYCNCVLKSNTIITGYNFYCLLYFICYPDVSSQTPKIKLELLVLIYILLAII